MSYKTLVSDLFKSFDISPLSCHLAVTQVASEADAEIAELKRIIAEKDAEVIELKILFAGQDAEIKELGKALEDAQRLMG